MRTGRLCRGLMIGCLVAGCDAASMGRSADDPPVGAAIPADQGDPGAEIEAPEVFLTEELGLWDGRPSLGGIWVAHPDVDDPARVRIVNLDDGRSTIGALFRRERENPGPRLMVSSEAAAEIGLVAGQPTEMRVIALRSTEPDATNTKPEPTAPEQTMPDDLGLEPLVRFDRPNADGLKRPSLLARARRPSSAHPLTRSGGPDARNATSSGDAIAVSRDSLARNAQAAGESLRRRRPGRDVTFIGGGPDVTPEGSPIWRVPVVVDSVDDRATLLAQILALGYATPVSR